MKGSSHVAIHSSDTSTYPRAPFHPGEVFPELQYLSQESEIDETNTLYGYVRSCLELLELDKEHIGTSEWNPFREFVQSGQRTVIKPNLVRAKHPLGKKGAESMITHASVIRPLVDYVLLATGNKGKITIGDVSLQTSDWEKLIEYSGLKELVRYYKERGIEIELLDMRKEIAQENDSGVIVEREYEDRDPRGYSAVNLGKSSRLMPVIEHSKKFEITDYGSGTVPPHHNEEVNEYCVPNTILQADFFINVPKLKTHRKAGITCAMKNLVGINGDKRWLAHHRRGGKQSGGDEYEKFHLKMWLKWHIFSSLKKTRGGIVLASNIKKIWKKFFWGGKTFNEFQMEKSLSGDTREKSGTSEGSWYGNDTIWRCIIDLNNIIFFADKKGDMTQEKQRKYFCLVDGILAGEREGPMEQTPKESGVVLAGTHPVAIDFGAAHLMGFDWRKIPQIREGFLNEEYSLTPFAAEDIELISNIEDINGLNFQFIPSSGWKGKIEREQ